MDHAETQKDFSCSHQFKSTDKKDYNVNLSTQERPKRVRIFKNDFLESLTLVRWQTIFKFWIPVILLFIYIGNIQ
jgi:hypothetical protein